MKHINVVAGLIFREQRLLVCQRREDSAFPLKWEFPGGKVEEGESHLEALRRELLEELGVEVQQAKRIFSHSHIYPGGPRVSLWFFHVREYRGEIVNHVFQQVAWVQLSELSELDFLEGDLPLVYRLSGSKGASLLL
jgi:8-oxo-dGTP diphosphatase